MRYRCQSPATCLLGVQESLNTRLHLQSGRQRWIFRIPDLRLVRGRTRGCKKDGDSHWQDTNTSARKECPYICLAGGSLDLSNRSISLSPSPGSLGTQRWASRIITPIFLLPRQSLPPLEVMGQMTCQDADARDNVNSKARRSSAQRPWIDKRGADMVASPCVCVATWEPKLAGSDMSKDHLESPWTLADFES